MIISDRKPMGMILCRSHKHEKDMELVCGVCSSMCWTGEDLYQQAADIFKQRDIEPFIICTKCLEAITMQGIVFFSRTNVDGCNSGHKQETSEEFLAKVTDMINKNAKKKT